MARSKICLKNIKNSVKFSLSSPIKNETRKIFITVRGLMDAKYSLIKGQLCQTIGVINLNKIKKLEQNKTILAMGKLKLPGAR